MELAPMNDMRNRVQAIAHKILGVTETLVDRMAAPPAPPPPVAVMRRLVANRFRVWELCANATCRKARCCRGEPLNCLRYGLPVMPDALAGLMKMRHPNKRRRRLPARDETC
jgi:hypothetical protein